MFYQIVTKEPEFLVLLNLPQGGTRLCGVVRPGISSDNLLIHDLTLDVKPEQTLVGTMKVSVQCKCPLSNLKF